MPRVFLTSLVCLSVFPRSLSAGEPLAPPPEFAAPETVASQTAPPAAAEIGPSQSVALDHNLAHLEARFALLLEELRTIRAELAPSPRRIMTPQDAYDSYHRDPDQPVTVEFGVSRGWETIRTDVDLQREPITVTWDYHLHDQRSFSVTLLPEVWRALRLPGRTKGDPPYKPLPGEDRSLVGRHIQENGLRVTGLLNHGGRSLTIADPTRVVLYLTGQPGTETYSEPLPEFPPDWTAVGSELLSPLQPDPTPARVVPLIIPPQTDYD